MKRDDFYTLCARICTTYPVYRKRYRFSYKRPVSHPLCKNNNCVSTEEKYQNLRDHKGENMVHIDKKTFNQTIKKSCFYCGIDKSGGIDRLKNNIGYTFDNIVPCCAQCNYMKKNLNLNVFLNCLCRVYNHQKKKM